MDAVDDGKMSFFEHLAELRTRIVWSLVGAGIGLIVSLAFAERIIKFVSRPITSRGFELVFTGLTDGF